MRMYWKTVVPHVVTAKSCRHGTRGGRVACVRRGDGDVLGRCGEGARRRRARCQERAVCELDLVSISARSRLDLG